MEDYFNEKIGKFENVDLPPDSKKRKIDDDVIELDFKLNKFVN